MDARHKQWKHWGGHFAVELSVALADMDSLFVRCGEEHSYQRRLAAMIMEVHQRLEVPKVVSPNALSLPKGVENLYCLANYS